MNKNVVEGFNKKLKKKLKKNAKKIEKNAKKGAEKIGKKAEKMGKKAKKGAEKIGKNAKKIGKETRKRLKKAKNNALTKLQSAKKGGKRKMTDFSMKWRKWRKWRKMRARKILEDIKYKLSELEKKLDTAKSNEEPDPINQIKKEVSNILEIFNYSYNEYTVDIMSLKIYKETAKEYLNKAGMIKIFMENGLKSSKNIFDQEIITPIFDKLELNKGIIRRYISENDVLEVKFRIKDLELGIENYFAKKIANMNEDIKDIEKNTQKVIKCYDKAVEDNIKKEQNQNKNDSKFPNYK